MKHLAPAVALALSAPLLAQTTYGTGCPGGNGLIPRISFPASSWVNPNSTGERVLLLDGAPGAAAALLAGTDPGSVTSLPLDVIGMNGCNLYINPVLRSIPTFLSPAGVGDVTLPPIPQGLDLVFQWAFIDDTAPRPLTITSTAGLRASTPALIPTFRVSAVALADPHVFTFFIITCLDGTSTLNSTLNSLIQQDADPIDGLLDSSLMFAFRPYNNGTTGGGEIEFYLPECTAPAAGTTCAVPDEVVFRVPYSNGNGNCLGVLPGTTDWAVTVPGAGPCFVSDPVDFTLTLGDIPIPLVQAQIAGNYLNDTTVVNGLVRGFISEATANATLLPADFPIGGGAPLSSLLPGGVGNCGSAPNDKDIGPGGQTGWWVYINFAADAAGTIPAPN